MPQGQTSPGGAATTAAAERVERDLSMTTVHATYATAQLVQKARDIRQILRKGIEMAELAGEIFFYRWETSSTDKKTGEVKKSYVAGPSVKLTNEAARLFNNCVVQQKPVVETRTAWIFTSAFIDLETGFTRERQFRMDKQFPIYGRMDKYRKDDIRFQIGQSKADRNVVSNSLPYLLIDRMLQAALDSTRKAIEFKIETDYGGNREKYIDAMLGAFAKYEIDQELIERKLALKRKYWDIETLVLLKGDFEALRSGSETKNTLYSIDETEDEHGGATQSEPPKTGLSVDDMKPGNAENHQPVSGTISEPPQEVAPELSSTTADLMQRIGKLSEEKTPYISTEDRERLVEIGTKMGGWTDSQLEAAIREIEEMKPASEQPPQGGTQERINIG